MCVYSCFLGMYEMLVHLQSVIRGSARAAAVVVMRNEQAIIFLCALSIIIDSIVMLRIAGHDNLLGVSAGARAL